MTDTPPPEPEVVETPKAVKRKRTRLQAIGFIVGCVLGGLALLIAAALFGGRLYIVSDAGRELISGFVQGQKISRYGRINVYGLKGDLFDDFTLERVTITDLSLIHI